MLVAALLLLLRVSEAVVMETDGRFSVLGQEKRDDGSALDSGRGS